MNPTPENTRTFDKVLTAVIAILTLVAVASRVEREVRRKQRVVWVDKDVAAAIKAGKLALVPPVPDEHYDRLVGPGATRLPRWFPREPANRRVTTLL